MCLVLKYRIYLFTILIYFLIISFGFHIFKYYFGQDVIQYLSISHKYLSGDYKNAINGYWGPLISWLLIPFLLINVPELFGFKILQALVGVVLLIGIINFSLNLFNFEKKIGKEIIILFSSLIIILPYYIFFTGTPDLLLATCIFFYLYSISSDKYIINKKRGLISGILGALAYFTKAYGLLFFMSHFILVNLYYFYIYPDKKGTIKTNFINGLFVFVILCSVWIILLSYKYHHFTYSTAGSFNFSIVGPEYRGIHTFRFEKLYPPVNKSATSYWEDPSFLPVLKWSVFNSWNDFKYLLIVIGNNIKKGIFYLFIFSPLFLFLLALKIKLLKNKNIFLLFASVFLYSAGFLPLFLDERYLIFPQIILIIITFYFLNNIVDSYPVKRSYKWLLYFIFFASITCRPVYSFFNNSYADKEYFTIADNLKYLHIKGNFAGLSSRPLAKNWGSTLFLAYELKSKFYGEINSKLSPDSIYNNLKKDNINYLFVWDKNKLISHPAIHEIFVTNLKTYDNNNYALSNKFINEFYSIFNLEATRKENIYLKLYRLD